MIEVLIALTLSVAAAGLIFYSWRQKKKLRIGVLGWLLAFASAIPWSSLLGTEIGITYAVIIFIFLVWIEVALGMGKSRLAGESVQRPFQKLHWPTVSDACRHVMIFLFSIPGAGVIALALSVGAVLHLPWTMTNKFAAAIFLYPVVWGALSAWICAQNKLIKPTMISLGLIVVTCSLLFI